MGVFLPCSGITDVERPFAAKTPPLPEESSSLGVSLVGFHLMQRSFAYSLMPTGLSAAQKHGVKLGLRFEIPHLPRMTYCGNDFCQKTTLRLGGDMSAPPGFMV